MIVLVEGEGVGSGKSYYATTVVAAHIADGGTVISNDRFELLWNGFSKFVEDKFGVIPQRDQWRTVPDEDVYRLHEVTPPGTDECPVLIVIDETQGALNTRDTSDKAKRPFFSWLCQSRHDNNDLLFITQNINNIDVQMRRLATYTMRVFNMASIKIPGLGAWPLKQFLWKRLSGDGKQLQDWTLVWQDSRIFKAYKSKACAGKHNRLNGEVVGRRKLKKVKRSNMKMILVLVIAGVVSLVYFWRSTPWAKKPVATPPAKAAPAASIPALSAAGSATVAPPSKVFWRTVSEEFRGTDGATFLRTAEGGTYEAGTMSDKGFVEQIRGRCALLLAPDGGRLYVVGHDTRPKRQDQGAPLPVPAATPVPVDPSERKFVGAKWEPVPTPFGDGESARIKAELARPIGFRATAHVR